MFGNRRRRGSSNPPPLNGANANPNAATAAAQAFLKSQASNASLASAAAGAALRSRPTTPVSIADIQTKRMLRRSGSTSSVGSSAAGSTRPNLERRGSNGSMSERTFRDPSPARPVPSAVDAPPVPAIPKNIQQSKAHRRATSLEAPQMRVASPPPNKANGRGSSLGPGVTTTPPRKTGQRRSNLSSVQELTGIERSESRGSVNFSYPTSSRPTSPINQRRLTSPSPLRSNAPRITSPTNQNNLVYDPNTRSFLPLSQIIAIEQRIQDASNQTVKKKKRIAPAQNTGTHLADGTVGGRIRGTAVDAMEAASRESRPAEQPAPITADAPLPTPASVSIPPQSLTNTSAAAAIAGPSTSAPKKKKKKVVMVSDSDSDQASYAPNSSDNDSDFRPAASNNRSGATLVKKPSIVREDREAEEEGDYSANTPNGLRLDTGNRPISPTPLPRSAAGRGHGRGQASASAAYAQGRQHTRSASQPAPDVPGSIATNENGITGRGSVRGGRVQSVSPARNAHFATTPDSLMVKHQPPARSISPRKSALKHHSSSPRGPSPIGGVPGAFDDTKRQSVSEASNISADDSPIPRKKSVRVSFDEKNVLMGDAAPTPNTDSTTPQGKRGWFSLGRGKKKDAIVSDDNDDEVMKPRPALPSFGSVRERKNTREPVEERQLVKPTESVAKSEPAVPASPKATSPLFTSPTGETLEFPMGQSNDHVVGAVLSQDAAFKNEANISKSREPLPPQVLSVEGSGDHSDSDSTVSGLDVIRKSDVGAISAAGISPSAEIGDLEFSQATEAADKVSAPQMTSGEVPQIAVSHPTPTLEETETRREWPDMPGGFPSASSTSESDGSQRDDASPTIVEHHATDPTPADLGIAEPYEGPRPGSPVVGEIAAENHVRDSIILEETEDESVYSDAAEDLSDAEGDGFQSLNAVVESPVSPITVTALTATPPDSPTTRSTKERAFKQSQLSRKSSEPDMDEGWEKAQEYWKGLSADKKRQLEQEAREEAEAEDSDSTIEAKPLPVPKKKKKIAAQPAQQAPATVNTTPAKQTQNGRTYMIQPGSKADQNGYTPVIRSSMRADPPVNPSSETHIRKSMRGQGSMKNQAQGSMRGSLRDSDHGDQRVALQKKNRPTSLPASEIKADPDAVKKHVRALSAASASLAAKKDAAPPTPTLRRKNSGDSDSSFKRTKPTGVSHFRSSMRRDSVDQSADGRQQSQNTSSRFSLRSLSPTSSTAGRRPFNTPQPLTQTHMRSSMRSSQGATPSMRGPKPERAKSPMRIPGFGRSSSAKPAKQKPVPQRASRFADSSDEEDARPSFRSRFVDSSDDDDDEPLPRSTGMRGSMRANQPVRAIPRPTGVADGDSSDLPDSDDEKSPTSPKLAKNRPNGTANSEGLTLASGSLRRSGSGRGTMASPTTETAGLRPKNTRRGSFMSILRRKKADPSSKVRKSEIESAARRDTPLERSRSDLQAVRRNDSYNSVNGPSTPKLQKRNNSGSWPLPLTDTPPKILGGEDGRPFTADDGNGVTGGELANGNKETGRPDLGTRRFTATGMGEVDLSTITGKEKKKKKFQGLRKMFRLND